MTTATYYLDAKGRQTIDKDPGATLDYPFDWTDFLTGISDTIQSVSAAAVGVTVQGVPTFSGMVATVWATGGVVGTPATLTCTIVTVGGRTEPMTIQLKITPKVQ